MTNQLGEHIVKSYDEELARLTSEIQRMGDLALNELEAAIAAVVERDSEGLRGVVQEGPGQQLEYTVTGHTEGENEPMLLDAALVTGGGPTRVLVYGGRFVGGAPNTAFLDQGPDGGDDRLTTHDPDLKNEVVAASKILAYRIVDVQIRDYTYKRQTYRFANVVLAVRIVDAEYGTVVWSGTIQNVVEDKVPAIIAPKLRR